MRITDALMQTGALQQLQKSSGVSGSSKSSSPAKSGKTADSVSISKEARKASEGDKVSAHVAALPDMREDRIADVKARVKSGYYNSPEFQDQLAEKLLKEFGVHE